MANKKNGRIAEAEKLYREGMRLVDIAHRMDVPEGTVRRWKCTHGWDTDKGERSVSPKANVRLGKENKKTKRKVEPAAEVMQIMENPNLTEKQRLFCIYYIRCFNAAKAYQKAYQCEYRTALTNGPRLLRNACVKEEISSLKTEKLNREFFSEEDVFQRYMDIAFVDMNDYVDIRKDTIRFKDSDNFDGSLIKKVSCGKVNSIEMLDAMQALKWLADHMDLATEEQRARIESMKAKLTNADEEEIPDDGFLDALNASAEEDWEDEKEKD